LLFYFFTFLLFYLLCKFIFFVLNKSRHVAVYCLFWLFKRKKCFKNLPSFPSLLSLQAFGAVASSVTSLHIPKVFISKIGEDGESLILMADTDKENMYIVWLSIERQNPFSVV
jgi:hypothetical protein